MNKTKNNETQVTQARMKRSSKVILYLLLSAVLISLSACGGSSNSTPTTPTAPTIVSFTASPSTITKGESSTIRWDVTGTQPISLFITGSSGATDELTGTSRTISPTQTSTFTLTAKNSFGEASKELTITVDGSPVNPAPPTNPVNQCTDINIPDVNLEAALRAEDTIPDSGPISCADMETLTSFGYSGFTDPKISDITGLNFATNLQSFDFFDNDIPSIENGFFSDMTSLTLLSFQSNGLISIENGTFSGLTSLTTLNLDGNNITSIESGAFSDLTSLRVLNLEGNAMTSIISGGAFSASPLRSLTNLTNLNLSRNNLSSINAIDFNGLGSLEQLNLQGNNLRSIESNDFSDLSSLTTLELNGNAIRSIESGALSSLTKLTGLRIGSNNLNDVAPIQELAHKRVNSLTHFMIDSNCLSDKVPTQGILAGIQSNTSIFYGDNSNPKTSGTPACPNPLPAQAASVSNFDLDPSNYDATEAWSITGNGSSTEPSPVAENGQNAGFIQGTDGILGETWYFKAPQQYYGDASDYKDGSLTYHLNQLTNGLNRTPVEADDIILQGGGITLSYKHNNPNPNQEAWKAYTVPLSATAWINKNNNTTATSADMDTVLANLSSLEIRGDYVGGADVGLDSVVMEAVVRF